ncbi:MAG TPA: mycofactocin biosynthesis glycosyltransferase MftF, partial [bacterium]
MLHRIYTLAPRARLVEHAGRRLLVSDHPLQQFALNDTAWQVLSALSPSVPIDDLVSPVAPALLDFLEEKTVQGALRAEYRTTPPSDLPRVEVIIPVYTNAAGLQRCLEGLSRVEYPTDRLRVSVVDDGSPVPARDEVLQSTATSLTVRWLRLGVNQGPASARNAALDQPWPDAPDGWGDLCAFIDSDCVPRPQWLRTFAAAMEGGSLVAAGGQVLGLREDTWLARYEAACSSLNLGDIGGAAGEATHRHPYLPSCNLIVRRGALRAVGGFRAGLRLAEDVDLCWRLRAAGGRLFYYPPAAVAHDHRRRLLPFLWRKRAYARSEAWLRRYHPAHFPSSGLRGIRGLAIVAAIASAFSTADGLCVLVLGLLVEALVHRITQPRLGERLRFRVVAAAAVRRSVAGLAQVCRGALRAALVLWLPLVLLVPTLWPALLAMLALGGWAEWQHRRPALRWWTFAAGASLDAFGYSVG